MKTKLVVRPGFLAISFDEKSFFSTFLGFNHGWNYKQYNQYISQKFKNLSSTKKVPLKCDVIDGSIVECSKEQILFSFVLDKPSGYKLFCEPETVHRKKNKQNCFENYRFRLRN